MTLPSIDFTVIKFPSDKLTIKDLRHLHPDKLDVAYPDFFSRLRTGYASDILGSLLISERNFAFSTYEASIGRFADGGLYDEDHEEVRKELIKFYEQTRLASGPKHAEQLIRAIESQVKNQAKAHGSNQR